MNRRTKRVFASLLAFTLVVSPQTGRASAMDYPEDQNDDLYIMVDDEANAASKAGDIQLHIPDSVDSVEADKAAAEIKIDAEHVSETGECIGADLYTMAAAEGEDASSTIYYGTMSGNLSAKDDYVLYPATLAPGDYLQARLAQPDDSQIDYDLLLFDSSLSLIKSSDYVTYMNDAGTLEESIGYIAAADERVYVCVYSVAGGSTTDPYTVDYSITTNFTGANEPDENAKEATALTLAATGAKTTGMLNSPIDNDWYSFTVIDSPTYHRMRFQVSSSSKVNGCKFELYRNLVTSDYYGMQYLGSGTGGEVRLPVGTYYLRIVSTNTFDNFNGADIPAYDLSVVPVARVDMIKITDVRARGAVDVPYGNGTILRVEEAITQVVLVKGTAYYLDGPNLRKESVNAQINGKITDPAWEGMSRPDMAYVYSSGYVDEFGSYSLWFQLNSCLGVLNGADRYDIMTIEVRPSANESIFDNENFMYLKTGS